MILAISNETTNVTASGNVDAGSNLLDLIDFTFDTFIKSAGATNLNLDFTGSSLPTYLGVAGHNLGTIGATITVINNGATVISNYAPVDDRPLMFPFAENGSGTVELNINTGGNIAIISHVGVGKTTDLSSTTALGQVIDRDFESGFPLIPNTVPRKVKATINQGAAPTAVLLKTISVKATLNIKNVPIDFIKGGLLTYQKFWVSNGFFISHDEIDQSYLAFEFTPNPPKAHGQTRNLANISYRFTAYNGQ